MSAGRIGVVLYHNRKILNDLEALGFERFGDLHDMVIIPGLHLDSQEAAVDALGLAFFIMHTGHIAAAVGDDAGDILELAGLVDELDEQAGGTSGFA